MEAPPAPPAPLPPTLQGEGGGSGGGKAKLDQWQQQGQQEGQPQPPPPPGPAPEPDAMPVGWIPRTKEKRGALLSSRAMAVGTSADIEKAIPWRLATAFRRSSEGSTGVFFVEVPDGVVVVKGCESIVPEVFAAELARLVDIAVPRVRVIEYTAREWREAKQAIIGLAAKTSEADKIKAERELRRAFFIVMEFVRGTDLERLGTKANAVFNGPGGEERLQDLGELICLDIVLNNWDRMPLIWDNEGNFRNVFVAGSGPDDWQIVGIDQGITPLQRELHAEGYDRYMQRVKDFVQCFQQPNVEAPEIVKLRECFATSLGIELSKKSGLFIQQGIHAAAQRFSEIKPEDLAKMKEDIARMVHEDWEQVWERGVAQIHLPMLEEILQIFKEALK